jgi:hypothetical protein
LPATFWGVEPMVYLYCVMRPVAASKAKLSLSPEPGMTRRLPSPNASCQFYGGNFLAMRNATAVVAGTTTIDRRASLIAREGDSTPKCQP